MANADIDNWYIQLRLVPNITFFLNINCNFNFNYNNIQTYQCNIPVLNHFLFYPGCFLPNVFKFCYLCILY